MSANLSQTAYRWRREGRIFAVTHGGTDLYPAFQFGDDGQPRPIIAEVLAILAADPRLAGLPNERAGSAQTLSTGGQCFREATGIRILKFDRRCATRFSPMREAARQLSDC